MKINITRVTTTKRGPAIRNFYFGYISTQSSSPPRSDQYASAGVWEIPPYDCVDRQGFTNFVRLECLSFGDYAAERCGTFSA